MYSSLIVPRQDTGTTLSALNCPVSILAAFRRAAEAYFDMIGPQIALRMLYIFQNDSILSLAFVLFVDRHPESNRDHVILDCRLLNER